MMQYAVEVSIIVPAYNAERFLRDALESIRAQTFTDYEVIVVDDGSIVSPRPIVRSVFPEAQFVAQSNQGPSAARNAGVALAKGRFLGFLDSDDLWPESALEKLRNGFRNAPAADVVQGHIKRFPNANRSGVSSTGRAYLSFNVGSLLVKKSAFDKVGGFDETLRQSEDVALHIRFKEDGLLRLVIPDTVLLYRHHAGSSNEVRRPQVLRRNNHASWMRLLSNSLARRRTASKPARLPPIMSYGAVNAPPVTAVLTVKDARRYLPFALSSMRAQRQPIQSIFAVVANGGDGSLEYLEEQGDVTVLHQTGSGLAQARNQVIENIRGGLVAFLDCDDLWDPRKIELQLEALSLFHVPGFSITNFRRVRDADRGSPDQIVPINNREFRLGLTPSALLAHRAVFEDVGGFDAKLGNGCDTDWFSRALRSGLPCAVVGQVLMYKRIHTSNLSVDPLRNRRDMFRIIGKRRRQS